MLAGGVGLGAYQAGAYATLHAREDLRPDWIAAASVGAANAAIIAGSPPEKRLERLAELWIGSDPSTSPVGTGAWRHAYNWTRALQSRVLGAPGHFHPRYLSPASPYTSFYDLSPLRARLQRLVDFGRLNSGAVRFSVVTTDIETGEAVVFDTAKGDRITVDHLLASAGYLPEFSPIEIGGRLLGDGGLSTNAPVEAVLLEPDAKDGERLCFVVDLFARDGLRPTGLESALARKNDLMFSNQTWQRLELHRRVLDLEARLADAPPTTRAIFYLSYRASPDEAGPEKMFDLSGPTARDRWTAGELDMAEALRALETLPRRDRACLLHAVRRAA